MLEPPILSVELAKKIERLVAPELRTKEDAQRLGLPTVVRFGQTIASKAKGGQPSNKVFCFSADDIRHLDEILEFYSADELVPSFYLTPAGYSREVGAALTAAGFAKTEFEQAILYGVPAPEGVVLPRELSFERVTPENVELYARTMAEGFEWDPAWQDSAIEDTVRKYKPEVLGFLLRWEGEPAGVATLGRRESVGKIVGGAVVPRFRGKGIHGGFVRYRVHLAHQVGCDFIMGAAAYGSASFRNQLRAGLQLAYVESGWTALSNKGPT